MRADERGVVVPSRLMVVAIVVVAIAAVMYVATAPGRDDARADSSATPSAAKSSARSTPSGAAKPSKTATKDPSVSPPSPTTSASAKPSAKPVDRAATFVAVFNNSGRVGLAARTASTVTGKGWKVVATDNWYGSVPETTVYFPKGKQPAARVLAKDLGITRVMPAVAPMRGDRLTVILTKSFRG